MEIFTINLLLLFTVDLVSLFGKRVAPSPLFLPLLLHPSCPLIDCFDVSYDQSAKQKVEHRRACRFKIPVMIASPPALLLTLLHSRPSLSVPMAWARMGHLASSSKVIVSTYFWLRAAGATPLVGASVLRKHQSGEEKNVYVHTRTYVHI